jgi:uracil-DNA glycosylase family 4
MTAGPIEKELHALETQVVGCRACPRLVEWRERIAHERRAAYRDEAYWGRPVPGFGDPTGRLLIVGLAPAAHGANRTGRMFTGDRSGEWLYEALFRFGFASQAESVSRSDGLRLVDAYVTAVVRCAPPGNKPLPVERAACRPFFERELDLLLPGVRCVVALGQYAFDHTTRALGDRGVTTDPAPARFGHGSETRIGPGRMLLASYHPSQQNTFTGKLTKPAFYSIWERVRALLDEPSGLVGTSP